MLLFERLQALRGFENCLMDFYQEPEKIAAHVDRLVEYDLASSTKSHSAFRGGFILSIDENAEELGIPHENTLAMIDGFLSATSPALR